MEVSCLVEVDANHSTHSTLKSIAWSNKESIHPPISGRDTEGTGPGGKLHPSPKSGSVLPSRAQKTSKEK